MEEGGGASRASDNMYIYCLFERFLCCLVHQSSCWCFLKTFGVLNHSSVLGYYKATLLLTEVLREGWQLCITATTMLYPKWPAGARFAELICASKHDDLLDRGNKSQMANVLTASDVHWRRTSSCSLSSTFDSCSGWKEPLWWFKKVI